MNIKPANWMIIESENYILSTEEKDEIFKRGAVISIKHPAAFEPILSVIQKIQGERIFFRVPEAFLRNNILKGDEVTCHVMKGDYEYIVEGMISEFDLNYPWFAQLLIQKIDRFRNNRRDKRYLANFQSKFTPSGVRDSIYAIIKNISLTGICAVFKEDIEVESLLSVFVNASIEETFDLEFKAKVNRVIDRQQYKEYGLEILEIDDINKDKLDRLIYRLECNEAEFVSNDLK